MRFETENILFIKYLVEFKPAIDWAQLVVFYFFFYFKRFSTWIFRKKYLDLHFLLIFFCKKKSFRIFTLRYTYCSVCQVLKILKLILCLKILNPVHNNDFNLVSPYLKRVRARNVKQRSP